MQIKLWAPRKDAWTNFNLSKSLEFMGKSIGLPISRANSIKSSMTFLGCSFPAPQPGGLNPKLQEKTNIKDWAPVALAFKWKAPRLCGSCFSGPGAPQISPNLTRSYERIVTLVTELHEIYPKSVHDLGLRPELPGLFIGPPTRRANSIKSSMTFFGCPFPVQSSTTFMRIPYRTPWKSVN